MTDEMPLLIVGASVRAAAFSALRAGLRPWAIDLFRDADLQACCPTIPLAAGQYPHGLAAAARKAPPGPWMYTGGLENRPAIVRQISRERPLWGNNAATLRRARSPRFLARLFAEAKIPFPAVRFHPGKLAARCRWLVKPRASAGGMGIHFWEGDPLPRRPCYFQEFIDGEPCSAVYVADGRKCRLLGMTRQLVGAAWLHAGPFQYCGSVGPLQVGRAAQQAFRNIGHVLANGCQLRGLFGVDCILRDNNPWPIEVNPRWTASVEVLEHATGLPALAFHRRVFDARRAKPQAAIKNISILGKAILFARGALTFPTRGPWKVRVDPWQMPAFADIPPAGQRIEAGRPILTFFVRADSEAGCLAHLRKTAAALDRRLFGG